MKSTAANSRLRRLAFAVGLVVTGAAAVLSPDWSAVLKAQGYYGNVDLGIEAFGPTQLRPGQDFALTLVVRNQGPDTAHRVRTISTAPQLIYFGGDGCDGPRYPQCALSNSMGVGGIGYSLYLRVPDDVRNHVQFSASVTSDDTEIQPGDEIVVMKIPVYVPLDLRSDIACARAGATGERSVVRCSIRFLNAGGYAARLPQLQASLATTPASTPSWSCESAQPALCAGAAVQGNGYAVTPVSLPAASSVTFFVEMLPRGAVPVITLDADARLNPAMGETDLVPGNNRSSLRYEPSLFAHDFEPAG